MFLPISDKFQPKKILQVIAFLEALLTFRLCNYCTGSVNIFFAKHFKFSLSHKLITYGNTQTTKCFANKVLLTFL
jgi:hypothetical protein